MPNNKNHLILILTILLFACKNEETDQYSIDEYKYSGVQQNDNPNIDTSLVDDGCVDFVALWSASDIAEQTGMNKRWVFRNYTVEIWDIPPSDPRPGRIIDELRASSYARIIDKTDSEYLVESPMTGIHGWLDKTHVKTISRKNPETKKLCK